MIEIEGLQKLVGGQTALDIPALRVPPGQVVAVAGPAGSGVAILFDLLTGRAAPSAGRVRLAGAEPTDRRAFSQSAGVLFAEDGLYRRFSPQANLALHCRLRGLPRARALEVLAQIGMADQAGARLDKLPSGGQRRLAFGRAILHRPPVLLLYEPFARCDAGTISLLGGLVRRLADEGASVLILADDTAHLPALCDTIYVLEAGRLAEVQPPAERQAAAQPFKIPVRTDEKVVLMNPADILFAEAQGGRTSLLTTAGRLSTQFTLAELEERLSRSGFFRAHRSYLVNLQRVREIVPYTRNSFSLMLDDPEGTEIPLSKAAAAALRELLGY